MVDIAVPTRDNANDLEESEVAYTESTSVMQEKYLD
jgi:hypothetical protein